MLPLFKHFRKELVASSGAGRRGRRGICRPSPCHQPRSLDSRPSQVSQALVERPVKPALPGGEPQSEAEDAAARGGAGVAGRSRLCARGGAERGGGGQSAARGPRASAPTRSPPEPAVYPRAALHQHRDRIPPAEHGRARLGRAPGPGRAPAAAAAAAAAAARAAGPGSAGRAEPRRRGEEQLPPHGQLLLAERQQPVRRGQRARRAEVPDQADREVRAGRGPVRGDAVEGLDGALGRPRAGRLQPVPVLQPGLGGQQPGPRPPAGGRHPPGLLVPVPDPGLHLRRPAPAVRPLLLGGAGAAVLHVLRVRPAQARGRAGARRAAAVLRGGGLLHDRAHGRLLARQLRPRRPRRGGEAGAPGEPGQTAQHPPQPGAGEPRPPQGQVKVSRPARPSGASAGPRETETEEKETAKPHTILINAAEQSGRVVRAVASGAPRPGRSERTLMRDYAQVSLGEIFFKQRI